MAKMKSKSDNYVYMAVGEPVSASTSALSSASATASHLYSLPSKAKSVSFLLSEQFESTQDTTSRRPANSQCPSKDVVTPATLPRYFVTPKFEYEDEFQNIRSRDRCGHCGVHSAVTYSTSENNSPSRTRNSHSFHDSRSALGHSANGERAETLAGQSYRRHSVGGKVSTERMYSRYNTNPQFSSGSTRRSPCNAAEESGTDAYHRRMRTPRIFDNVGVSLDKYTGSAMHPYFYEDQRHYLGSAKELQRQHQLDLIPREICSNYEQRADLSQNVYYIKAAACDQSLSCECACACPCSSPATHLRQLVTCARVLPGYDTTQGVEGYVYRYCDQDRGFDYSGTDEDFAVSSNHDDFYQTSLPLAREHYRHRTTLSICIKILWPCVFLNQDEVRLDIIVEEHWKE